MRVFIRHEDGLADAAHVVNISNSGHYGGYVGIRTIADQPSAKDNITARLIDEDDYAELRKLQPISDAEHDGYKNSAARVAENLVFAISRGAAIAKRDDGGAVIEYNRKTTKWVITPLSRTATDPEV